MTLRQPLAKFFFWNLVIVASLGVVASASSVPLKNRENVYSPQQPLRSTLTTPTTTTATATLMCATKSTCTIRKAAFATEQHRGGQQQQKGTAIKKGPRDPIKLTTKAAVIFGMVLAFNSGYINGICLSGILASDNTKQAAAAVTGAWTNSALGIATGNHDQFFFHAKCILSYISGSAISGLLNPFPVAFELPSSCGTAFLIGGALMVASSNAAGKGGITKSFFYYAAIANGIQNSITSTVTSNLVRSTHFSGISSDMGTFLGQVLSGNKQNLMKLKVFSALAISFWVGGLVSYRAATEFNSSSLLYSGLLYVITGLRILSQAF